MQILREFCRIFFYYDRRIASIIKKKRKKKRTFVGRVEKCCQTKKKTRSDITTVSIWMQKHIVDMFISSIMTSGLAIHLFIERMGKKNSWSRSTAFTVFFIIFSSYHSRSTYQHFTVRSMCRSVK